MKKLLALFMFVFCSATFTFAQSTDDYHKFEVYGGYSHNRVDTTIGGDFTDDRTGFNGFNASITGNISRYIGLKFDYAFHRKTFDTGDILFGTDVRSNLNTFLGGVQIKDNSNGKIIKPFAHALAGVARTSIDVQGIPQFTNGLGNNSETGFSAALGGGLDIGVSRRIDIRAFQFDYNPTRFADSTQHNFRFGVGIVFH
ncbi:MAG: outer membrane protein [Pyrinomonadaceae bacterium]